MLSNQIAKQYQIATSNIKMKTYQQLWQSLTPLYDAGEAQAIVRTVLDVEYGMTLTDIICGKVNELSSDEEEIWKKLSQDCKMANRCSMFWAKPTLLAGLSM